MKTLGGDETFPISDDAESTAQHTSCQAPHDGDPRGRDIFMEYPTTASQRSSVQVALTERQKSLLSNIGETPNTLLKCIQMWYIHSVVTLQ